MKRIKIKKLWFGDADKVAKVTLRSYQLPKGPVEVVFEDKSMILTEKDLKSPVGKRFFKSKIGAQDYYLLDYKWEPNDRNN